MPRASKADRILVEAKELLAIAVANVDAAQRALETANAELQVHRQYVSLLESAAAPKSREKVEAKPAAVPKQTEKKPALCGVCGNTKDYEDHFRPSPNYHKFDSGKGKKKQEAPLLTDVSKDQESSAA